jgi:AcrR family transcriptional regulator
MSDGGKVEGAGGRQALLAAGARLFAERGYSAAGVQDVVNAAGVNKAMLYYHFGSKAGLYDVLIAEGLAGLEVAIAAAEAPEGGLRERLTRFARAYLALAAERADVARVIYREVMGAGERSRAGIVEHFAATTRRLAAVLAAAQVRGEVRGVDATVAAYSLFGMATMFITRNFVSGQAIDVAPLAEQVVEIFLGGVEVQA